VNTIQTVATSLLHPFSSENFKDSSSSVAVLRGWQKDGFRRNPSVNMVEFVEKKQP
jgi:hypothetical protein